MRAGLNKKKQELRENTRKIDDLMTENKSLKERLDNLEKSNESKTKEKVTKPNIIDDLKKSFEALSTPPEILQDVRKRDDKDDEMKKIAEISKAKLKLAELETVDDLAETKSPKDFKSEIILKNINKYKDVNLNDVNNLIDEIKKISL